MEKFDEWAILEIMGHQRYAGRVCEETIGGASFIRVDVPASGQEAAFSKLFGAGSIYAITPVTEEVARMYAQQLKQAPVNVWDLPEEIREKIRRPAITQEREEEVARTYIGDDFDGDDD